MYPDGELSRLEASRSALHERIGLRRQLCTLHATRLARPIRRVDHLRENWQRVAPAAALAAVPLGLLFRRRLRRLRLLRTLVRLAPVAFALVRAPRAAR